MIRFTSIRHNPNTLKTVLSFLVDREDGDGDPSEHSVKINEAPPPEFCSAFTALREHVAEICDEPGWKEDITVTHVALSYKGESKRLGAVFTIQKKLPVGAPLCLSTPFRQAPADDDDGESFLSQGCREALGALVKEAKKVFDGARAQGTQGVLFNPGKQTQAGGKFTTGPKAVRAAA